MRIVFVLGLFLASWFPLATMTRGFAYAPRVSRLASLTGEQTIVVGGFAAIGLAAMLMAAWELRRSR